jgi:hypothetical protein
MPVQPNKMIMTGWLETAFYQQSYWQAFCTAQSE